MPVYIGTSVHEKSGQTVWNMNTASNMRVPLVPQDGQTVTRHATLHYTGHGG